VVVAVKTQTTLDRLVVMVVQEAVRLVTPQLVLEQQIKVSMVELDLLVVARMVAAAVAVLAQLVLMVE
jgi:hypothetical protein